MSPATTTSLRPVRRTRRTRLRRRHLSVGGPCRQVSSAGTGGSAPRAGPRTLSCSSRRGIEGVRENPGEAVVPLRRPWAHDDHPVRDLDARALLRRPRLVLRCRDLRVHPLRSDHLRAQAAPPWPSTGRASEHRYRTVQVPGRTAAVERESLAPDGSSQPTQAAWPWRPVTNQATTGYRRKI